MMKRVSLLIFVDYFTPGYKAGGPIQSLKNLISVISDEINIYLITRNHDWGTTEVYENVEANIWIATENYHIKYLRKEDIIIDVLATEIENLKPDVIFCNSFFSKFTRKTIQLFRLRRYEIPIVIAPRGEFMNGAFATKFFKKIVYLKLLIITRLLKDVHWLSTSAVETKSIRKKIGVDVIITCVSNLPNLSEPIVKNVSKKKGELSLVFLSRIDPKKNLDFLLNVLVNCESIGRINLDIYGSKGDKKYFDLCKGISHRIPKNISVNFMDSIPNCEVIQTLAKYHFFILPTKGENYGHAIFESFIAGTPVIISDRTPWVNLRMSKVGVDLPLEMDKWVSALRDFIDMENQDYLNFNLSCSLFALKHRNINKIKEEYLNFFSKSIFNLL